MTNDELDKKSIETGNWIADHWKIILGIITILFIIFITSFAAIKINNKIDSLINENEELKKATVVTPQQATDSNYLQNALNMRKSDADRTVTIIERSQTGQVQPGSTVVVQAPSAEKATEVVREKIEEKDPTMPKEALEKTDRTIISEQPENKDYQVGVYKINTYRNWGIGTGIGKLGDQTYIPVVIHRQYKKDRSIEIQANYNVTGNGVDGFQVTHTWHF